MLSRYRATLDTDLSGLPPVEKVRAGGVKMSAVSGLPILEAMLYPEDRDGE